MNKSLPAAFLSLVVALPFSLPNVNADIIVVDFEDFDLSGEADGYLSGPAPNAVPVFPGAYNFYTDYVGSYDSNGVRFQNVSTDYGGGFFSESQFSISNTTDTTTPGFTNESSAFAGSGAGGSSQYAVGFGWHELSGAPYQPYFADIPFDSMNVNHLAHLPTLFLPANATPVSTLITNTTYAALSMQMGDGFAKKFGGASGTDQDYFKLSVFGIDGGGNAMGTEIEFYLADYRFADPLQDTIVDTWELLDLSPLAGASSLHFNLDSSDVGMNGMNTPGYFAIDNFTYSTAAVPEPGSFALLTLASVGLMARRLRAGRRKDMAAQDRSC